MKYNLSGVQDMQGKKVIVRSGFDVPLKNGVVQDTSRIESVVPTIEYITSRGGVAIILAHQGRPSGKDPELSQQPIQPILVELLEKDVVFCPDCTSEQTQEVIQNSQPGAVILLENLRFNEAETSKDAQERLDFARSVTKHADAYVNEAFTNSHRSHASMVEMAQLLPSYVGLALEQEIIHLEGVFDKAVHPITLIVAGAKIDTKVPVISHFLARGDTVLVGGLIGHAFLEAKGIATGTSTMDQESVDIARQLLAQSQKQRAEIILPIDSVTATSIAGDNIEVQTLPFTQKLGFDIGPESAKRYAEVLKNSQTIIWNGPVGVTQKEAFAQSSITLAHQVIAATKAGAVSIIGGGDTIDTWNRYNLPLEECTFVSMGGGAMLTYISDEPMPALDALER